MVLEWNVGLLSMAMLLLLPKRGTSNKLNPFFNWMMLVTILCLTVGHSVVSPVVPLGLTVFLCVFRIVRQPGAWVRVRMWGQALVFAFFVHRCEQLYPFRHWSGIPSSLLIAIVIGMLLYMFRPSRMDVWILWSMVFLIWVVMEWNTASPVSMVDAIGWFWQVELILYFMQWIWDMIQNRIQKSRERTV